MTTNYFKGEVVEQLTNSFYLSLNREKAARNQKIAKKIAVERDQIIDKLIDQINAWELKNNCN